MGALWLLVGTASGAAQPLDDPRRTVSCDPASSPLYSTGSDLAAACERRLYRLPVTPARTPF